MNVSATYNLAVMYPDVAKEWHPTKNGHLTPTLVAPKSHKKVWWRCHEKHEWQAIIASRSSGQNCPLCSEKKRKASYLKSVLKRGSLAEKYPALAKEWHPTKNNGLIPTQVAPKSNKKVWWQCEQGHEWQARVHNRSDGTGCPHCFQENRSRARIQTLIRTGNQRTLD